VEEVATLASRFGWSYETLMSMTGAERRLWLTAAENVAAAGTGVAARSRPAIASPPTPSTEAAPASRLTTEAERRARLLELSEQFAARYRR
jgi:hypothetical protein